MPHEDIERRLKNLPLRDLPPGADAEIIAAIRNAERTRTHWWTLKVPVWQAVAACLVLCGATWLLSDSIQDSPRPATIQEGAPTANTVFVRLDKPFFAESQQDWTRVDITRWGAAGR